MWDLIGNKNKKFFQVKALAFFCAYFIAFQLSAQTDSSNTGVPKVSVTARDTTNKSETPRVSTPVVSAKHSNPDSGKTPKRAEKLTASFDTSGINIEEGEVFSKNLRVISNINTPLYFKADVSFPAEWRTLLNKNKVYQIDPHDTLYVPVRLVPMGKVKGNTKYIINAYLFDTIGSPITSAYIQASKPKFTKWSLNVGPNKKIYFKNDSSQAGFTVNIGNEGTEDQEIYMTMGSYRKDIILMDSSGRIIKNPKYDFILHQFADTTMHYRVKLYSAARNMKRVDTEGYRPGKVNETKSYSVFVKTTESSLLGSNARSMYQKMDFVQLPNEQRIFDYGMYSLPMTMQFNMSNMLSLQPVANLFLYGGTGLSNGGFLSYNTQFLAGFGVMGGSYFAPPFFTVGYYDNKYSILVGDVGGGSGGIGVGGKGINGSYKINNHHRVGAFFVVNPGFLNRLNYYGAGLNYSFNTDGFRTNLGYTHLQNMGGTSSMVSDYANSTSSLSLTHGQAVSFGGILARNTYLGITKFGYALNAGYSGTFLKSRLQTSISGGYFSSTYTFYNQGERYMFNHNSSYRLNNKWQLRLLNTYNQHTAFMNPLSFNPAQYKIYNNSLGASRFVDIHSSFGTSLFYNIIIDDYYQYITHSRGLAFNYNYSLPENTLLYGFSSQFGYNKVVSVPNSPEYFFMNLFSLIKYRVYSLNFRYVNGLANAAITGNNYSGLLYSQNISIGFNEQYQFRNRHFILNNFLSYNLMPRLDRHSFGYTPELNFYSNNGWRIYVTAGYYLTSSKAVNTQIYNPYQALVPTNTNNEDPNSRTISQSYTLMFGLRKTFGIPIPFIKRRFPTLNFIAFVDLNGNGKFDSDESRLENVVINVNGWEVLTDDKGNASLKNLPEGNYVWQVFSLTDLEGFFPNIPEKIKVKEDIPTKKNTEAADTTGSKNRAQADSSKVKDKLPTGLILVPFVKGVKLVGKVYIDREKFSPEALSQLDLSGIRVSVNLAGKKNSTTLTDKEGNFMFYLPYGEYIVSMDERILGTRFRLLQNDIEVTLDRGIESMFVSFYIAENQRLVVRKRFGPDGKLIEEGGAAANSDAGATDKANADKTKVGANSKAGANSNAGKDLVAEANAAAAKVNPRPAYDVAKDQFLRDKEDATTTKGLIYTIQLGAFQKPLNPAVFGGLKNVMYERIDKEFVRITVGHITNEAEAQAERANLAKVGFPGCFVSAYHDGKNISLTEAAQVKKSLGK